MEAPRCGSGFLSDSPTPGAKPAFMTVGISRRAEGLAERHQIAIPSFPVSYGKNLAEDHFRLQRCSGSDQSQAVAYPVDVDIDADSGFIKGLRHHEIGGFSPDSRKPDQILDRVGNTAGEEGFHGVGKFFQQARLGAVEPDRIDEFGQVLSGYPAQIVEVFNGFEQSLRYGCCGLIFGAGAQNGGNQNPERCEGPNSHELSDRRTLSLEMVADFPVDKGDEILLVNGMGHGGI